MQAVDRPEEQQPEPVRHVHPMGYLREAVRQDPSEIFHLLGVALTTLKYRYIRRCAGAGTVIGTKTEIVNPVNVHIGRNCLLQDAVYIRAGVQGKVTIGDRAAINSFCKFFGHGTIEIGEDTQIGPGTLITTTGHDLEGNLEASYQKVWIGKRVWIGANVTILPGVKIGDSAVIGAGSVVNKDIPPACVAVGVPARVIREIKPSARKPEPVLGEA